MGVRITDAACRASRGPVILASTVKQPPCGPAPGASSSAWSVCCMARAGTAAAGSGGVTGATGAAVWGAAGAQAPGIGPANGVDFLSNPFLF